MGPVAAAVLYGCLLALKWTLWLAAGLLVLLTVVQYLRGDAHAQPSVTIALAVGFAIAGLASSLAARFVAGGK